MATAFAEEAVRIRETGHLSDRDIARATGAGISTVGAWLRRTRSPRGERAERLAELSAIVERLARVMDPSYIPVWLHKPVPALDDEKPIDLLAEGEWRRVARLISALESPTFSQRVPLDVDATPVRGVWFRHVPAGGEPLFRPEHPTNGRWQRGEVVDGFDLADSEQTAWAEWYRALAELAVPPMRQLPRDLWRFQIDIERVADLSSAAKLERAGLELPVPDRRRWARFQAVGETLFSEGWTGILYPAAARPEALALCLFRTSDRLAGVRPLSTPVRYDEPPVPPRGLRA